MAFSAGAFAVTTTAQKVIDLVGLRASIDILNPASNTVTVWVGGSDVAVDDGRPIEPGESWSADLEGDDDVYIRASEPVTVYYSRVTK